MIINGKVYYSMLLKIFKILSPIEFKFIGSLGDDILNDFRDKFKFTNFNNDINVIHIGVFFKTVLFKFYNLYKLMSDKKSKEKVLSCIDLINYYLKLLNIKVE